MSDGVRLKTQIWIPKSNVNIEEKNEIFPVIFTRTCYAHQEEEMNIRAEGLCQRGYAFILQWCRGCAGSEGLWEPNIHERQDGLDTLSWICRQPFAGEIGYWGDSYLAMAGWCMADAVPDKVKSMYLGVFGTDRYTSMYKDGLFRQDLFTSWAMDNAGVDIRADYLESCRFRPQILVDRKLWSTNLPWYREWIMNTDRNSEYWSGGGIWKMMREIPQKTRIPIFIREGWYDHHLGSAVETFQRLSAENRSKCVFEIGPWRHDYSVNLEHQPTDRLENDSVQSPLEWFEYTLKGRGTCNPGVRMYVIGADRWIHLDNLQPSLKNIRFHFSGKKQRGAFTSYALISDIDIGRYRAEQCTRISYIYDPNNPVWSHGAESLFKTREEIGSLSQPTCSYRDDVISFVSEPLEKDIITVGVIHVRLYVSSDAEDTAFSCKLMEEFEDGDTVNVRGTITTLAYRNDSPVRITYISSSIVEINMDFWPIAWRFCKRSKLRIDISSSDFPQYAIHTNYPGIWSVQEKSRKAEQSLYFGEEYDSVMDFPILLEE